jgi:hypothetical protein
VHPVISISLKLSVNVTCHGCGKIIFLAETDWQLNFNENTIFLNDHLLLGVVISCQLLGVSFNESSSSWKMKSFHPSSLVCPQELSINFPGKNSRPKRSSVCPNTAAKHTRKFV